MSSVELLEQRLAGEEEARQQAESLLEKKSQEHLEASEHLRALAERNQAILDTAAEGVITINDQNQVESFNREAERIFGYTAEEINKQAAEVLVAEQSADIFNAAEYLEETTCEGLGKRKSGDVFPMDVSISEVYFKSRLIRTAILRDTSRRKMLQAQLAHARKLESVGQLAAGMAHEINTPLQFIGDNTRFMKESFADLSELLRLLSTLDPDSPNPTEPLRRLAELAQQVEVEYLLKELPESIEQALAGVERVSKIVAAIKEFSHPGAEHQQQSINLNHAIDSILTVAHSQYSSVADVETDFDESLPHVTCFANDVNQAILSVSVNSAHAIEDAQTQDGYERGSIQITTLRVDDDVEVSIRDTGPGIPEAIRNKIFDPFFTTKQVGRGIGQGLSMVHAIIVDRHGGSIRFETEFGRGTTFFIRLPIHPANQSTGEDLAESPLIG